MTETLSTIRDAPENPAGRVAAANGRKRPGTVPPAGWSPPDRAPQLRRAAELLEAQADRSQYPDRVRRLARDYRIRAVHLELGDAANEDFDEIVDWIEAMYR